MNVPDQKPLIRMQNVDKSFGNFQALKNINLEIRRKERIVVCGPSGSGKSTMIRCLNRLEAHTGGRIFIDGKELSRRQPAALVQLQTQHRINTQHLILAAHIVAGPLYAFQKPFFLEL